MPSNLLVKRIIPLLAISCLVVACAVSPAQQYAGARQVFDGKMLPGLEVSTFEHSDTLFPVNTVARGGSVRPLPQSSAHLPEIHFTAGAKKYDLFDYIASDRVAGMLILKEGKTVFEDYELGFNAESRWISFSMAKSISSTLIGAALKQGLIASLDDPIVKYVPALKSGAYDTVTVRDMLLMASAVKWDETYTDPKSDRRKLLDIQLAGKPGSIIAYMKALTRAGEHGAIWNYSTGDSFLVGAVIEGATHRPLAQYLSEALWSKLGMEQDATWWLESPGGMGLGGSGLGASMRDFARFAQFVLDDGVIDGQRIVPEGWFREAGNAHIIGGKKVDYGYLWWPLAAGDPVNEGAFEAIGIFGQHIYLNPREKLAIVVLSARPKPDRPSNEIPDDAFFTAAAHALH